METNALEKSIILVVDDDPHNLGMIKTLLNKSGYEVRTATDGEEALERVKHFQPDLILLDVLMPGIDGFETCRRLKEIDVTKDIPVIFLTALSETTRKLTGFKVGGVDYVTKPLEYDEVLARVKAHLTIQCQKKKLVELNATKDKFFSIISHDLKSPFMSLMAISNLIGESGGKFSPSELTDFGRELKKTTDNTYKLLENLLEWARLQQDRIEVNQDKNDLMAIVRNSIDLFQNMAKQKGVRLINRALPETTVVADTKMITTVMRNLISNAIKFSNEGGQIVISSQIVNDSFVEIAIADTGLGIDEDGQKKLFRIDREYQRKGTGGENGTGLGLILCKEFVERNGGKIWVESEEGKGSIFRFRLPGFKKEEQS